MTTKPPKVMAKGKPKGKPDMPFPGKLKGKPKDMPDWKAKWGKRKNPKYPSKIK